MDIRDAYAKLRVINNFLPLDQQLPSFMFAGALVSGIGVVVNADAKTNVKILRRFRKVGNRGKVFMFDRVSTGELAEFAESVLFLVSDVEHKYKHVDFVKSFGVVYSAYKRFPKRLRLQFPPWEVVRGEVRISKRNVELYGTMRVETYDRYSTLFICHPGDLERRRITKEGNIFIEKLLESLVERYRYNRYRNPIETIALKVIPLFSI